MHISGFVDICLHTTLSVENHLRYNEGHIARNSFVGVFDQVKFNFRCVKMLHFTCSKFRCYTFQIVQNIGADQAMRLHRRHKLVCFFVFVCHTIRFSCI